MQNLFYELNNQIKNSQNILLTTHPHHDGDALGSLAAMIDWLENSKKKYTAILHEEIMENFNFLPHLDKIKINYQPDIKKFDTLIILDAPDCNRAGLEQILCSTNGQPTTIVIDHHQPLSNKIDIHLADTKFSSTAEIIFDFFKSVNHNFDKYTATALLTGIATDTENFSNPATNCHVIQQASQLLKRGANLNLITKKTFGTKKIDSLKLLGLLLSRLQHNAKFNLVSTVLTQKDLLTHNLKEDLLDGTANFLKNIKEGEITLLLRETLDGKIKGSLRSHSVNIEPLARALGGGGHTRAAGFVIDGSLVQGENGKWVVK